MHLLEAILTEIPAYESYPSMDAADAETLRLARVFPARARVQSVCETPGGRELLCLTLYGGPKRALAVGSLAPNEPAGMLAVEFLSRYFCEHPDALDALGITWRMIKSADPDGTALNEGWFGGPFDLFHYARGCYRASDDPSLPQAIQSLLEDTAGQALCLPRPAPLILPGDWHAAARAFLSVQTLAARPLLWDSDPYTVALDARLAAPPGEKGSAAPLLDLGLLLGAVDRSIVRAIGPDAALLLEILARTDRFLRDTCQSIEALGGGAIPSIRDQVIASAEAILAAATA